MVSQNSAQSICECLETEVPLLPWSKPLSWSRTWRRAGISPSSPRLMARAGIENLPSCQLLSKGRMLSPCQLSGISPSAACTPLQQQPIQDILPCCISDFRVFDWAFSQLLVKDQGIKWHFPFKWFPILGNLILSSSPGYLCTLGRLRWVQIWLWP